MDYIADHHHIRWSLTNVHWWWWKSLYCSRCAVAETTAGYGRQQSIATKNSNWIKLWRIICFLQWFIIPRPGLSSQSLGPYLKSRRPWRRRRPSQPIRVRTTSLHAVIDHITWDPFQFVGACRLANLNNCYGCTNCPAAQSTDMTFLSFLSMQGD